MAKNYHEKMSDAFHGAEKKMAGKSSGGYDHHPDTLMPKNARATGEGASDAFKDRPDGPQQAKSEKMNRTGYGSKSKGADIDGDVV